MKRLMTLTVFLLVFAFLGQVRAEQAKRPEMDEASKKFMAKYDTNGDGALSAEEMIAVHELMAVKAFDKDDALGAERVVLTVFGRADKAEEGENTLPSGDISTYVKFRGAFAAYAGEMGEGDEFRSGVMIIPDVAADMLASLLAPEEVTSVNFGFLVGIKKTETPIGYEYYASPLMEDKSDTDPMEAIKQQVTAALPAPKKDGGKAAAKK